MTTSKTSRTKSNSLAKTLLSVILMMCSAHPVLGQNCNSENILGSDQAFSTGGYEQKTPTSLVGMLKSTIDGLEPLLGRPASASARSRFFPADERVVEIVASRVAGNLEQVSLGWSLSED